ncbi:peptidase M48, Ste24p [Moraxella macacae 0408225]|uniref:Protease HtpX n=1 Tax=Moraxella macacae 0408225 TaxID=1230338 RepID=L2F6N5_9GAMM|nr:protease HtpX [Moraxella macacae]ELA08093.1 peptidase M48, Ste24p [Moraxella macacae 0408225]
MLRIGLFLLTNIAVMVVFGIVMMILSQVFGIHVGHGNMTGLMVMCFMYGMIGSLVSLFLSKWMAKRSTGTKIITNPSNPMEIWLIETVRRQAEAVNIDMPEVGIFDNPSPNAFATGWNKNQALVAVSTGLLQTMNQDEVEAVLAHEIGHVANGDMVTLALVQGVMNAFVMFFARIIGQFVDKAVFKNEEGYGIGYYLTTIVLDIVFGFAASAIVMWFSRYREFRADEMGAKLAGRDKMIAALNMLKPASGHPDYLPENMKSMAINEGKTEGFSLAKLFASHPSLDDRIASLQKLTA